MQLAPSERVLLHARDFVGGPSMTTGREELLLAPDTKVALNPLGETVLAAVILAAEEAGVLRLEQRPRKALFGLRTVTELYAVQAGGDADFPEGSYERRLAAHFKAGERTVGDLLHDVMEEDTSWPAVHALSLVKRGLAARGLLATQQRKRLKVFTTTHQVATQALRLLAAGESAAEVRAAIDACERERPEIWKLLRREVGHALSRRKEVDTTRDGPDFD